MLTLDLTRVITGTSNKLSSSSSNNQLVASNICKMVIVYPLYVRNEEALLFSTLTSNGSPCNRSSMIDIE